IEGRNGEVLIDRRYCDGQERHGAILAIEVKKRLTAHAILQAEAEFHVWQTHSSYPFYQTITDLNTGGLALWTQHSPNPNPNPRGKPLLHTRTFDNMGAFWRFVAGLISALPADTAALDQSRSTDTLDTPLRHKHMVPADPRDAARALRECVAYLDTVGDVACLDDVANL
ncbi:hypothetical protein JKP88DRAFT_145643, partial [Tribonema minus]